MRLPTSGLTADSWLEHRNALFPSFIRVPSSGLTDSSPPHPGRHLTAITAESMDSSGHRSPRRSIRYWLLLDGSGETQHKKDGGGGGQVATEVTYVSRKHPGSENNRSPNPQQAFKGSRSGFIPQTFAMRCGFSLCQSDRPKFSPPAVGKNKRFRFSRPFVPSKV